MSGWRIVLHEQRPENRKPGDMWPAHGILKHLDIYEARLSPRYWALPEPRRAPLVVCLPGGVDFCIDFREWNSSGPHGDGWAIAGDGARITLSPSIDIRGSYHGWIRDGVITEDCEGRTFPGVERTTP